MFILLIFFLSCFKLFVWYRNNNNYTLIRANFPQFNNTKSDQLNTTKAN